MTLPTEAVTLAGSGLTFINSYEPDVTPAYREAAIQAENFLQSQFTNQLTISVDFDFQPIGQADSAHGHAREINGAVSAERRYYISSLPPNALTIAQAVRSHWRIEN